MSIVYEQLKIPMTNTAFQSVKEDMTQDMRKLTLDKFMKQPSFHHFYANLFLEDKETHAGHE